MYRAASLPWLAALTVLFVSVADAQDYYPPHYPIYFEASSRIGNNSDIVQGDLFLPTLQSQDRLLFADLRGNWLEPKVGQGSIGVGYRKISDCAWIYGGSAYFDRNRSINENYFSQFSFGLEAMSVLWDFRANAYFPQTDPANLNNPTAVFANNSILIETMQEAPYKGTDFEVGRLLMDWKDGQVELRGFATGFYFNADRSGFEVMRGGRARLELRLFDLPRLGENSRVVLGAQYQFDNIRDSVTSGLLSVRIPLGRNEGRQDRLRRRMLNAVVRDNIVTNVGLFRERAIDAETGAAFGNLSIINANTANVPLAVANAGSLVIADGSLGEIALGNSILLQDGQTLRGAGFEVIGEETRSRTTFGAIPTFRGTDPTQSLVQLASNSVIRDSILLEGANGIFGNGVQGFRIENVQVSQALNSGIELAGLINGSVINSRSENNGIDGLLVDTLSGGLIEGNTFNLNARSGISVQSMDGGVISNNDASANTSNGIEIVALNDGSVDNNFLVGNSNHGVQIGSFIGGDVNQNVALGNTVDGFHFDFVDFNATNNPEIDGNIADSNDIGFHFVTLDGGNATNNIASNNVGHGFQVDTMSFGSLSKGTASSNGGDGISVGTLTLGTIGENLVENNVGHGIFINEMTNGSVRENTLQNNGLSGLALHDFSNGQIRQNTATSNSTQGYLITHFNFGVFEENVASQNVVDGFQIANMDFGSRLEGNTSTSNGDDGFEIGSGLWSDGEVLNNTASNNVAFGYHILNRIGGTASGNSASGNGDNTLP